MEEIKLPDPVGHIHSNGDFCAERQVESRDWPVNLYTADQMREAILAEREQADEAAKRYRWLRDCSNSAPDETPTIYSTRLAAQGRIIYGPDLDAAVDDAISKGRKR